MKNLISHILVLILVIVVVKTWEWYGWTL